MPPKPKHIPKLPDLKQGEFFTTEEMPGSEATGGLPQFRVSDVVEGGHFPADTSGEGGPTINDAEAQVAIKAAHKLNRKEGNKGKHSARGEDGLYHPWVGSYLPGPGGGAVLERYWEEAKRHAEELNIEILRQRRAQPQLGEDHAEDVFAAVAYVASRLDIGNGLKDEGKPESSIPPLATTQDKIMALHYDGLAGYMPTHNREKSQGFEMLHFLRLPKGAGQRLLDIFYKQQSIQQKAGMSREQAVEMAHDSVRSVVNEWGDYVENARQSVRATEEVLSAIKGLDPRLTLKVAFSDVEGYTLDFRPLVRYFDLQSLPYYPGESALGELTTRTDRTQSDANKNKTVEDEYTRAHMSPEIADRIDAVLSVMRVEDALKLAPRVIEDQKNRDASWNIVLNSAAAAGDFTEHITPVIERVRAA